MILSILFFKYCRLKVNYKIKNTFGQQKLKNLDFEKQRTSIDEEEEDVDEDKINARVEVRES